MRVGIFGRGRLAQAVMDAVADGTCAGTEIAWSAGKGEVPTEAVDIALDASAGTAVAGHLAWAIAHGVDIAIGATGWDPGILADLAGPQVSGIGGDLRVGILVAPNFSLSVAFMRRVALALGGLAGLDPAAELSVFERHHRAKADAPSGTARILAASLAAGCPRYTGFGPSPARQGEIPVASLREGREIGYHELRLEAADEVLVFSHEARDRRLFARGALASLTWLHGRKGVFTFDDFAAQIIDPLFLAGHGGRKAST